MSSCTSLENLKTPNLNRQKLAYDIFSENLVFPNVCMFKWLRSVHKCQINECHIQVANKI